MKKKYEVVFVKSIYLPVYVNASSEDEAEDIANEILDEKDFNLSDCTDIDISDITEVDSSNIDFVTEEKCLRKIMYARAN